MYESTSWVFNNVIPTLNKHPIDLKEFQNTLFNFLNHYETIHIIADMAQLVERTLGKGEVPSSTLGISTTSLLLPVSLCFNFTVFNNSGISPG